MIAQLLVVITSAYAACMLCAHGYLQSRDRRQYVFWFYQMKALAAFSCITMCGTNLLGLFEEPHIPPEREITKFCTACLCFAIGTSRIYLIKTILLQGKRTKSCQV